MIYKRTEVDHSTNSVNFEPPASADFTHVSVKYRKIIDSKEDTEEEKQTITDAIQGACGQSACAAKVKLIINEGALDERIRSHFDDDISWLAGATIQCDAVECPLRGPGGSSDREPRVPSPETPQMSAELLLTDVTN